MTRAIVTVVARDSVGIIAHVTASLAKENVNILDISQTILGDYFTMIMLVDLRRCEDSFEGVQESLKKCGDEKGLVITIQRQEIFDAMHRI